MPRIESGLFKALEAELKRAKEPLDCVTLFDRNSIKEHAESANRVSDYLGHLWRKGLVMRIPAPQMEDRRARWAYVWKGRDGAVQMPPRADHVHTPTTLLSKPTVEITEHGDVIKIDLPQLQIVIRPKSSR